MKENLFCDDTVAEIKDMPDFLARRVLSDGQEYHRCRFLVYDSVQGRGLAAGATKQYQSLYKYNDLAKNTGLCSLLIGHITKRGQVAGPKDLEHNIDAMVYLRRAFRLRPLFVPKNRFGPAVFDPLVLTMDNDGRLSRAPHTTAQSSVVYGWSGVGENLTEAQATVSLPRYGSSAELNAPNLPRARVKQLMTTLSQLTRRGRFKPVLQHQLLLSGPPALCAGIGSSPCSCLAELLSATTNACQRAFRRRAGPYFPRPPARAELSCRTRSDFGS